MESIEKVRLIQGGMAVHVSTWRLARTVAMERVGETAGTVSGTALDVIFARLLQLGDPGGHLRRGLNALDETFGTDIGRKICDRYFIEGGKSPLAHFKSAPPQIARALSGVTTFPSPAGEAATLQLGLSANSIEMLIASGFAEVWLAKEGHRGNIFINFLHKIELPLIYTLYGAILAGVDGVVVGAGNPEGLPAVCSQLANHEAVTRNLSVLYRNAAEEVTLSFDPKQVAAGRFARTPLKRPAFLAIVSLQDLVQGLAGSAGEAPDGFIIEHHTAGGHNASPVGPLLKDGLGQPVYSNDDEPDLEAIRKVGKPFWLAGGYDSRDRLEQAVAAGATGVQVGSVCALAEESGMHADYRSAILNEIKAGTADAALVRTTLFSPTGFPFKVVQLGGTLSEPEVFESRDRVCDIGLLQQMGFSKPNEDGFRTLFQRCPASPIASYVTLRGLQKNTEDRRCLCNGLLACAGLGQATGPTGAAAEEPAIVTLGSHLDGIRRLSRRGQARYWVKDVVADILG